VTHLRQDRPPWSIRSVWFVWLHETNRMDQTDRIDQMNKTDLFPHRSPCVTPTPIRNMASKTSNAINHHR